MFRKYLPHLAHGHLATFVLACLLICVLLLPQVASALDANGKYTQRELHALGIYFVGDEPKTTVNNDCSGTGASAAPGASSAIDVTAVANKYKLQSVIVKKIGGDVLGSYQSDQPPNAAASVLKLIIADVFLNTKPDLNKSVVVAAQENYSGPTGGDGSPASPKTGQSIKLGDALAQTLQYSSDTDANVLIDAAGGLRKATESAVALGYSNTVILSYYNTAGQSTISPNKTTVADLTKAMEKIQSSSDNSYKLAYGYLQKETVKFGLSSEANKWGGTSKVTGNSAVFSSGGNKYIISLYTNSDWLGDKNATNPKSGAVAIKNATNDIVSGLQSQPPAGSDDSASCCTPASTPTETATVLNGSDNEQKVFNFFISKGLKPYQAAGIMGNMQAESHFEPRLVEYGWPNSRGEISRQGKPSSLDDNIPPDVGPKGQPGYGLVQWTAVVRKQRLRDRTAAAHVKGSDLGAQLEFVMWELDNSYKYSGIALRQATNVTDATVGIEKTYEVHGGDLNPARVGFAKDILARYGSGTGGAGGGDTTTPTDSTCTPAEDTGGVGLGPYRNPLRDVKNVIAKNLPGRIDQGVDYRGDGPVYAISNGIVTFAKSSDTGWPGGTYIAYKLYDGPAKDKTVYVAENCTLQVHKDQAVNSNVVLCVAHNHDPWIETGWSKPGVNEALAKSVYAKNGDATAYGVNFDALMQKLGAPAGNYQNPGQRGHPVGSLPAGWPTW